jgi:hypothetical protein
MDRNQRRCCFCTNYYCVVRDHRLWSAEDLIASLREQIASEFITETILCGTLNQLKALQKQNKAFMTIPRIRILADIRV